MLEFKIQVIFNYLKTFLVYQSPECQNIFPAQYMQTKCFGPFIFVQSCSLLAEKN